jgi:two-component system, OmpR family, response regulator VicR
MDAKTILIVDDDPMIVLMLEDVLADAGYVTISARNGAHALALLAVVRADLILTDLLMPIMDGLDFCRAVLANPATEKIPLILMSAMYDLHFSVDFAYAGFLLKPLQIDIMLTMVAGLIGPPELGDQARPNEGTRS